MRIKYDDSGPTLESGIASGIDLRVGIQPIISALKRTFSLASAVAFPLECGRAFVSRSSYTTCPFSFVDGRFAKCSSLSWLYMAMTNCVYQFFSSTISSLPMKMFSPI